MKVSRKGRKEGRMKWSKGESNDKETEGRKEEEQWNEKLREGKGYDRKRMKKERRKGRKVRRERRMQAGEREKVDKRNKRTKNQKRKKREI